MNQPLRVRRYASAVPADRRATHSAVGVTAAAVSHMQI